MCLVCQNFIEVEEYLTVQFKVFDLSWSERVQYEKRHSPAQPSPALQLNVNYHRKEYYDSFFGVDLQIQ